MKLEFHTAPHQIHVEKLMTHGLSDKNSQLELMRFRLPQRSSCFRIYLNLIHFIFVSCDLLQNLSNSANILVISKKEN